MALYLICVLVLCYCVNLSMEIKICSNTKPLDDCPDLKSICECMQVAQSKRQEHFDNNDKIWLKISCNRKNMTAKELGIVTEALSFKKYKIYYFNINGGQLPVIENDMFLDLKIDHLTIHKAGKCLFLIA